MDDAPFHALTLAAAVEAIAAGTLTARALAAAQLARIGATDGAIEAWAHLDPAHVAAKARRRDAAPTAERGPLHGIGIGVKDIIGTADLPTELGTPIYAGRRPFHDAECVVRLTRAGAYVFGKTVTTEFAFMQPGKTRNPWNARHTPGGSSSGSAAAVAAGHVAGALGTQTNGSVIRPAAYCGVVGFKPTMGAIPFAGHQRVQPHARPARDVHAQRRRRRAAGEPARRSGPHPRGDRAARGAAAPRVSGGLSLVRDSTPTPAPCSTRR